MVVWDFTNGIQKEGSIKKGGTNESSDCYDDIV